MENKFNGYKLKILHALIFVCFSISTGGSQIVSFQTGNVLYKNRVENPFIDMENSPTNSGGYLRLQLNDILNYKKFTFSLSFEPYSAWTNVGVHEDPEVYFGWGTSSVSVYRNSLLFGYKLLKKEKWIQIEPKISLNFDYLVPDPFLEVGEKYHYLSIDTFNVPGNVNPYYRGNVYISVYDGIKVLPGVGALIKVNPFWRIYFLLEAQFTYGFNVYQRFYFEHSYKGEIQPTAILDFTGTGVFVSAGMGIKLFDMKIKNKK